MRSICIGLVFAYGCFLIYVVNNLIWFQPFARFGIDRNVQIRRLASAIRWTVNNDEYAYMVVFYSTIINEVVKWQSSFCIFIKLNNPVLTVLILISHGFLTILSGGCCCLIREVTVNHIWLVLSQSNAIYMRQSR